MCLQPYRMREQYGIMIKGESRVDWNATHTHTHATRLRLGVRNGGEVRTDFLLKLALVETSKERSDAVIPALM